MKLKIFLGAPCKIPFFYPSAFFFISTIKPTNYRSPTSSYRSSVATPTHFPKQEVIDPTPIGSGGYPTPKRQHIRPKAGGMPVSDIQNWQTYERLRAHQVNVLSLLFHNPPFHTTIK